MSIWCLNPACIFKEIDDEARAVVVTSGTLSPMDSFASELGVSFATPVSTDHVVAKENVSLLLSSAILSAPAASSNIRGSHCFAGTTNGNSKIAKQRHSAGHVSELQG
jgi:hypothetical protein